MHQRILLCLGTLVLATLSLSPVGSTDPNRQPIEFIAERPIEAPQARAQHPIFETDAQGNALVSVAGYVKVRAQDRASTRPTFSSTTIRGARSRRSAALTAVVPTPCGAMLRRFTRLSRSSPRFRTQPKARDLASASRTSAVSTRATPTSTTIWSPTIALIKRDTTSTSSFPVWERTPSSSIWASPTKSDTTTRRHVACSTFSSRTGPR